MRYLLRKLRPVKLRLSFFYWMAGVVLLIALSLWVASWWGWQTLQQQPTTDATKKQFDASLDVVKAVVGGIGTIATIAAGVVLYLNFRVASKNTTLTESRLITERFSKAVEQLGSDKIEVRLGGIYALERLAYDSDRDHWTIMEVLTSFIQEKSPIEDIPEEQIRAKAYEIWQHSNGSSTEQEHWAMAISVLGKPVTKDVRATLTVIGRRRGKDPQDKKIDLSDTNLQQASLSKANLQGAELWSTNLQLADLSEAKFQGAFLGEANLQQSFLDEADLQGAFLGEANLQGVSLSKANLQESILLATDLRKATLDPTQLAGDEPPLLCHVALPEDFPDKDRLKDRDCDQIPTVLHNLYPKHFEDIEAAKQYVDKARQKQWE